MVAHEPSVRGVGAKSISGPPLILQRIDDDFIGALLEQLRTPDGYQQALSCVANTRDRDHALRLYQPVHRTFHVVLLEAFCQQAGQPRLDPLRIDSAGMVVRRIERRRAPNAKPANPFPQGWLSVGRRLRGWQTLRDPDVDPDPTRRRCPTGGHPTITAEFHEKARLADGAEQVTPLFLAPPEVCEAAQRTILYGILPTASSEMSESLAPRISPDDFDLPGPDKDSTLKNVIPRFIRERNAVIDFRGLANRRFSGASAAAFRYLDKDGNEVQLASQTDKDLLTEFLNFVRFLQVSLDAFSKTPDALALLELIAELHLPYAEDEKKGRGPGRRADDVLIHAARVLVTPVPWQHDTFVMPTQWPKVSEDLGRRLYAQIKSILATNLSAAQPGIPRFEDQTARYHVRAFVRAKRNGCCPPTLCWTEPSERFSIVPWFENGVVQPIQIQLPNITRDSVKLLKPNVAFRMPKTLFNFLNNLDPKGLIDGKGEEGGNFGLDWICGFNISIIFLVAFIVMFMFLVLLNIVFWWLPFIKICFPLPSFSSREDS